MKKECPDCVEKCHICFKKGWFKLEAATEDHQGFRVCDPCWTDLLTPFA